MKVEELLINKRKYEGNRVWFTAKLGSTWSTLGFSRPQSFTSVIYPKIQALLSNKKLNNDSLVRCTIDSVETNIEMDVETFIDVYESLSTKTFTSCLIMTNF
jgi:hypothetical protein